MISQETGIDFPDAFFTHHDVLAGDAGRPQVDLVQHYIEQPTVYKWSLDVQQEIAANTTVDVGYSGTRGAYTCGEGRIFSIRLPR